MGGFETECGGRSAYGSVLDHHFGCGYSVPAHYHPQLLGGDKQQATGTSPVENLSTALSAQTLHRQNA